MKFLRFLAASAITIAVGGVLGAAFGAIVGNPIIGLFGGILIGWGCAEVVIARQPWARW